MATFKFELVSPERILFSGDVISVIVPSVEGEMTVLAGHAPLVATLKTGIVFVQTTESNGKEFFVNGGLVEVNQATTTILAEQGRFLEDVDTAVLDAEIVIEKVDIEIRMNELVFDELPDDASHLVTIELDNRIFALDLCHDHHDM